MPHSSSLRPHFSPGHTPSADTTQNCPLEAFTKLAAFISSAPWTTLSALMSEESKDQLRARLECIDASDLQIQPSSSVIKTCRLIHKWLKQHGERAAASRDIIPLSLLLLLKFRIQNCSTRPLLGFSDGVQIAVAFKIAYGNTSDHWMTLKSWEKHTGVPGGLIVKAELLFLGVLDWRTWVQDKVFTDFVMRVDMLWDIVLDEKKQ